METKKVNLSDLTPEQKRELRLQLEADERAEKERTQSDREAYKQLVDESVGSAIEVLIKASKDLEQAKIKVLSCFDTALDMKQKLFGFRNKDQQQSHTFSTRDGKQGVKIGYRVVARYDDTCEAGIVKVQDYMKRIAANAETAELVELVQKLLSRDQEGNLQPSRVLELKQFADKANDAELIDGIDIIMKAYRPEKTSVFIEAYHKDEKNVKRSIPLSIASIDIDVDN